MGLLELLLYCYHGIGPIQCFVRACFREIAATKKPKAKTKKVRMVLRLFIETGSRFSVKKKKLTVTRLMNFIARITGFATEWSRKIIFPKT